MGSFQKELYEGFGHFFELIMTLKKMSTMKLTNSKEKKHKNGLVRLHLGTSLTKSRILLAKYYVYIYEKPTKFKL